MRTSAAVRTRPAVLTSSRCSLRWQPHSRIIPVGRARCTQPGPARVMSASWKAWSANHNATSQCLPPWPRSVVRSADFSPLELAGSGRGCVSAADRNSRRVLLLVGVCSCHGRHGKYPPTRRIRTNNDLPARGALRPTQPAAAFLGGRRRPVLPTLAAVDDLIANVIIAVHPIAHDLGRQATLDWKITDSSYRVVVMNADAAPPSRSTAGSR